jgi:hypothetical protein
MSTVQIELYGLLRKVIGQSALRWPLLHLSTD